MDTTNLSQTGSMSSPETHHGPGLGLGALVGLLLIVPLTAIFFVAAALLGTSFVPFNMIDWMVRLEFLGGFITFGKELMAAVLRLLPFGELSANAKVTEQLMGVGGMIITGVVATAIFFLVLRSRNGTTKSRLPGIIFGLIVGVPVALITQSVAFSSTASPALNLIWIVLAFVAWGVVTQMVHERLAEAPVADKETAAASVEGIDRRSFLIRVGGAAATITVVGVGLSALLGSGEEAAPQVASNTASDTGSTTSEPLPNADAAVQPVPGTRPELTPVQDHYRIDISSRPPVIDGATYTLPVFGLVNNELSLSLDDLRNNYEPMEQYLTLSCISNSIGGTLISTQKWTGVSMQQLLEEADLMENARYLRVLSADGFDETVDIELIRQDERIMLAYAWDDEPLPERNGFPLRIYIPDRYGMKQPKWISEIEVVEQYQDGYWVRRGWDRDAIMVTTSVVDVVDVDGLIERDGQTFVPVGGIAHAGARSISKVEVRVDSGEWEEAQLREPLSDKTWVLWRYEWPFEAGNHTFEVRAVDGEGEPQIESRRGTQPSGATGIDSLSRTL